MRTKLRAAQLQTERDEHMLSIRKLQQSIEIEYEILDVDPFLTYWQLAAISAELDLGRLELRNQAAREGLTAPGWIRMVPGVARGRVRLPGSSCLDRPAGSRGMPPAARRGARGRRS